MAGQRNIMLKISIQNRVSFIMHEQAVIECRKLGANPAMHWRLAAAAARWHSVHHETR
jgi:hypothetical protein